MTNGTIAGVTMNEMMTGASVRWHEGWEHTNDTSASSFLLGSFHLGATTGPKRFEWVKMNHGRRSCSEHIPIDFWSRWSRRCGIRSNCQWGEWIPDGGAWQCQGYDENGLLGSLNGRLTDVHKVFCSAAEIACKGRQDFHLGHDGGCMIPIHSNIGQGMRIHLEKLVNWHGKNEVSFQSVIEDNVVNFS